MRRKMERLAKNEILELCVNSGIEQDAEDEGIKTKDTNAQLTRASDSVTAQGPKEQCSHFRQR